MVRFYWQTGVAQILKFGEKSLIAATVLALSWRGSLSLRSRFTATEQEPFLHRKSLDNRRALEFKAA